MISCTRRISSPNSSSPTWKLTSCSNWALVEPSCDTVLSLRMLIISSFPGCISLLHHADRFTRVVLWRRGHFGSTPSHAATTHGTLFTPLFAQLESAHQPLQIQRKIREIGTSFCGLLRSHGRFLHQLRDLFHVRVDLFGRARLLCSCRRDVHDHLAHLI